MAVSAAQLLDELMGRDRNRGPGEPSSKHHWSDPEVCKFFLCGFCPHELFTNTKADLGTCPKVHDEVLKKEYEKSARRTRMGYEENFMRFLQGIMSDVERRIRRGHERLALNAKKEKELNNVKGEDEKISMITDHINQLLAEIESLGTEGKVEEAQGIMKLVDQLKEEKETLVQMSKLNPLSSQEKQMEVCEICGAFLIVGDAQSRVDDHLQGKQHMGYARIKSTLEEMQAGKWKANQKDVKDDGRKSLSSKQGDKKESEGQRERSQVASDEKSQKRDRDQSCESYRDRDRRGKDRSHERRRGRERRRSRSRERRSRSRERRSKSRDKYRRNRSQERNRSKERSRRRSNSRERSRKRSRSRDRYRRRFRSGDRRDDNRDRRRSRSRERRKDRSRSRDEYRGRSRSQSHSKHYRTGAADESDNTCSKRDDSFNNSASFNNEKVSSKNNEIPESVANNPVGSNNGDTNEET